MEIENKEQIFQRRKEIERELLEMLQKTESDFGLDDIKEIIYNEDGQDFSELENILELTNDAWNYFPHKLLNGLSPAEKVLEYKNEKSKKEK